MIIYENRLHVLYTIEGLRCIVVLVFDTIRDFNNKITFVIDCIDCVDT